LRRLAPGGRKVPQVVWNWLSPGGSRVASGDNARAE